MSISCRDSRGFPPQPLAYRPSDLCVFTVVGEAEKIDWFSPSGDRIESNRPDVTVTRNDESSCTLTLYRAGVDNAGTYRCLATNGDQQAESTVNVKIYRESPADASYAA